MVDREEDREDAIFGLCLLWLKSLDRATNDHNQSGELDSAPLEGLKKKPVLLLFRSIFGFWGSL